MLTKTARFLSVLSLTAFAFSTIFAFPSDAQSPYCFLETAVPIQINSSNAICYDGRGTEDPGDDAAVMYLYTAASRLPFASLRTGRAIDGVAYLSILEYNLDGLTTGEGNRTYVVYFLDGAVEEEAGDPLLASEYETESLYFLETVAQAGITF